MIREISFDITYDCPFQCLHCSNGTKQFNQQIDFDLFKYIFDSLLLDNKLEIIEFGGGEPFVHKRFLDIVQYASKVTSNIIIYTSGCLGLIERKGYVTESCARNLKRTGVTQVNLTIHSHLPQVHNYISQLANGLERVLQSIKNLNGQKINICIHIVVTQLNYTSLKETMQLYNNIFNIYQFRLLRFVPQGRGKKNCRIFHLSKHAFSMLDFFDLLPNDLRDKTTVAGYPEFFKCRPHHNIQSKCAAGVEFIHVLPNGTIIPCPAFKDMRNDPRYGLSVEKFRQNGYTFKKGVRNRCWGQEVLQKESQQ